MNHTLITLLLKVCMQEALCETSIKHSQVGVCREIENTAEVITRGGSGLPTHSGVAAQPAPPAPAPYPASGQLAVQSAPATSVAGHQSADTWGNFEDQSLFQDTHQHGAPLAGSGDTHTAVTGPRLAAASLFHSAHGQIAPGQLDSQPGFAISGSQPYNAMHRSRSEPPYRQTSWKNSSNPCRS